MKDDPKIMEDFLDQFDREVVDFLNGEGMHIDYDKARDFIRNKCLSKSEMLTWLEGEKRDKVTFPPGANMEMPYNQMLLGYAQAIDKFINKIKS